MVYFSLTKGSQVWVGCSLILTPNALPHIHKVVWRIITVTEEAQPGSEQKLLLGPTLESHSGFCWVCHGHCPVLCLTPKIGWCLPFLLWCAYQLISFLFQDNQRPSQLKGTSEIPSHFPNGGVKPWIGDDFCPGSYLSRRGNLCPLARSPAFYLVPSSRRAKAKEMSLFIFIKCNGILTKSLTTF